MNMNVLGALEDLGLPREVSSTNILKLIKSNVFQRMEVELQECIPAIAINEKTQRAARRDFSNKGTIIILFESF